MKISVKKTEKLGAIGSKMPASIPRRIPADARHGDFGLRKYDLWQKNKE